MVRLRGLPWHSKEEDVKGFLGGVQTVAGNMVILDNQRWDFSSCSPGCRAPGSTKWLSSLVDVTVGTRMFKWRPRRITARP